MKLIFSLCTCLFFHIYLGAFEADNLKHILAKNKKLQNLDPTLLDDFATKILDSGLSYDTLEPKLNQYLKNQLPFTALNKAIMSEHYARWHNDQITRLTNNPDLVISQLKKLKLKNAEEETAIRVYALCAEPFKYADIREKYFKPKICKPITGYDHTRNHSDSVSIRTEPSNKNNARVSAYNLIINAGQEITKSQNLSNLEILLMARCMAENSIKFKRPLKHPIIACHESARAPLRSPSSAFFQEHGVCSNTAGIAYNIARNLGFREELYLARHHLHVFLETRIDDQWFHFHPLKRSPRACDFVLFPS